MSFTFFSRRRGELSFPATITTHDNAGWGEVPFLSSLPSLPSFSFSTVAPATVPPLNSAMSLPVATPVGGSSEIVIAVLLPGTDMIHSPERCFLFDYLY